MRTWKNILQHELIGLECEITSAANESQAGISGRITGETMKTLVIESGGKRKIVQKKGSRFRLNLGGKSVDVDGDFLVGRPEDRIKKTVRKW